MPVETVTLEALLSQPALDAFGLAQYRLRHGKVGKNWTESKRLQHCLERAFFAAQVEPFPTIGPAGNPRRRSKPVGDVISSFPNAVRLLAKMSMSELKRASLRQETRMRDGGYGPTTTDQTNDRQSAELSFAWINAEISRRVLKRNELWMAQSYKDLETTPDV